MTVGHSDSHHRPQHQGWGSSLPYSDTLGHGYTLKHFLQTLRLGMGAKVPGCRFFCPSYALGLLAQALAYGYMSWVSTPIM
jgi:hypothetical protein